MARLLIAGLLAAAAVTPLLAQPAPPTAPMAPRAPMAATMTRADVAARVQAQFVRRDANRDGFLTADELTKSGNRQVRVIRRDGVAMPGQMPGAMNEQQAMRDPSAMFDRLDANRDGSISRDEFARGHQMRIEKRVIVNRGGQPGQPGAMRGMRRGGGMMGAALLQRADANRDGRVTLAEATTAALQHFDTMDSNRDGRVTPDERAAGRAHMMQMRKGG